MNDKFSSDMGVWALNWYHHLVEGDWTWKGSHFTRYQLKVRCPLCGDARSVLKLGVLNQVMKEADLKYGADFEAKMIEYYTLHKY